MVKLLMAKLVITRRVDQLKPVSLVEVGIWSKVRLNSHREEQSTVAALIVHRLAGLSH